MDDEERNYWLAFSAFPGIGPLRFKVLREYFGSAKKAWMAKREELIKMRLGEKLTDRLINFRANFSFVEHLKNLKERNIRAITLLDEDYPTLLKEISDVPFLLYVRGDLSSIPDFEKTIAVVGTRTVTSYGRAATRKVVEGLVAAGLTIVSGMAYGVDTVAHQAAIEAGGKTIAVLGCGVDIIHPKSNTQLYWQIIKEKKGLVISEFPPGQYVAKGLFPARNRIISGLSLGVVVTEGAERSGALITARYAAEQGREVFAVPGPITSRMSQATNLLLKQGAKLVSEAADILDELHIKIIDQRSKSKDIDLRSNRSLSHEEKKIVEALQGEDLHFDEIVKQSGIAAGNLGSLLTMMEMKGYIKNLGGGFFSTSEVE